MLMFNKYHRFYKSCLFEYGMFYANIVNSKFIYSRETGNYIYNSLKVLKNEYNRNLFVYKETDDVDIFKINIYLLGLELKGFLNYLLSLRDDLLLLEADDLLSKDDLVFLNGLWYNLDNLITRIHNKMLKWKDVKLV